MALAVDSLPGNAGMTCLSRWTLDKDKEKDKGKDNDKDKGKGKDKDNYKDKDKRWIQLLGKTNSKKSFDQYSASNTKNSLPFPQKISDPVLTNRFTAYPMMISSTLDKEKQVKIFF